MNLQTNSTFDLNSFKAMQAGILNTAKPELISPWTPPQQDAQTLNNDLFFPVKIVPLDTVLPSGMHSSKGEQAVIRTDTNEIVKVHGARYHLIKNEDVYEDVQQTLFNHPDIDHNGVIIKDQVARAGGLSIRSYIFPEHEIKMKAGDSTQLRINVINSYDGSSGLRICTGGYRLVCSNGQIIGDAISDYRTQHTSGFARQAVEPRIAASLTNFLNTGDQWRAWVNTPVSQDQVNAVLSRIAGDSDQLFETLVSYWKKESKTLGFNKWALYNVMTFWSTHQKINDNSIANT
jgi:hypothetical protein